MLYEFSPAWVRFMEASKLLLPLVVGVVILLVCPPLGMMILYSFSTSKLPSFQELSMVNYFNTIHHPLFVEAFMNTLLIGIGGLGVALGWGFPLAWFAARTNVPCRKLFDFPLTFSLYAPHFALAFAWLLLASPGTGILNTYFFKPLFGIAANICSIPGIIFVLGTAEAPVIYLNVLSALKSLDPSHEESARLCGASIFKTLREITAPLITPGVIAGAILVFSAAIEVFSIPLLIGSTYGIYTLSTLVFKFTAMYPSNFKAASATAMILISFTISLVILQQKVVAARSRRYVVISGGRAGSRVVSIGRWRYLGFLLFLLYLLIGVVLPYFAIFYASFIRIWTGSLEFSFTLENFQRLFGPYAVTVQKALINSLSASLLSSIAATLLAIMIAWLVCRTAIRGRSFLDVVSTLPVAVPGVVMGFAFFITYLYYGAGLFGTIWIVVILFITRFLPQAVRTISGSIVQIPKELEEAASIAGASWLRVLREVIIPLIKPGALSALTICFINSFKEMASSIFVMTSQNILIVPYIYQSFTDLPFPHTASLIAIHSVILLLVFLIMRRFIRT
jgi:iron(III) transport system permease protein